MANPKTLINLRTRTAEERKKIASLGGKARQAQRKNQRNVIQIAKMILDSRPKEKITQKMIEEIPGIDDVDLTYKTAVVLGQIRAAMNGNVLAFQQLQKTIGEEPQGNVDTEDKLDKFLDTLEKGFKNIK